MLAQRVLTAIPLAALIIWILLFQPTSVVFWLLFLVTGIAGYEWAMLCQNSKPFAIGYVVIIASLFWICFKLDVAGMRYLVYASVTWWILVTIIMFRYKPVQKQDFSIWKLGVGLLVVPSAALAMALLHEGRQGPQWLLYGLMLVWVADIGAYFSGKQFGRHKLAQAISPGKTLEGVIGAVVAVLVYTIVAAVYFRLDSTKTVSLLILSIPLTLVSISGDLFESILKREKGVKDSGKLLPGHGGMLDRIDSVLAAMPVFYLGRELIL